MHLALRTSMVLDFSWSRTTLPILAKLRRLFCVDARQMLTIPLLTNYTRQTDCFRSVSGDYLQWQQRYPIVTFSTTRISKDNFNKFFIKACWRHCQWSIRRSAVALHCCKAHSEINRKMENSTPCKIVIPENFILKLGTRDYVEDATHYTVFDVDHFSGGFSPNRWTITLLWLFSCLVPFFFSERLSSVCLSVVCRLSVTFVPRLEDTRTLK